MPGNPFDDDFTVDFQEDILQLDQDYCQHVY